MSDLKIPTACGACGNVCPEIFATNEANEILYCNKCAGNPPEVSVTEQMKNASKPLTESQMEQFKTNPFANIQSANPPAPFGLQIEVDHSIPPNEVHMRSKGEIVGKIVNTASGDDERDSEAWAESQKGGDPYCIVCAKESFLAGRRGMVPKDSLKFAYDKALELKMDMRVAKAIKAERERIIEKLREYRQAYAEDLFTPIKSGEKNDGTDRFTTRVSGHMGRFILDNLIGGYLNPKPGGEE